MPVVTQQWADDVIVTITEGGSNYWAHFDRTADGKIRLVEDEASHPDNKKRSIVLDREAIQKGIDRLLRKPPFGCHSRYIGAIVESLIRDEADIDATEADIVAQAAVFDTLVYG